MAKEFFAPNAQTLNVASWLLQDGSAGLGFPAGAGAATLVFSQGSQLVNQNTDQSGNTSGVESIEVWQGWSGDLGDASNHFKFDCDGTAESAVNRTSRFDYCAGGGLLYYNSNNGCHFFMSGGGGTAYLTGGTFKHVHCDSGRVEVGSSSSCTSGGTWDLMGGSVLLDQHASNTFNIVNVDLGDHDIRRGGTTLSVNGGTTRLDIKGGSVTNLNLEGGQLQLVSHNSTGGTLVARGGILDFTLLTRPITFTSAVLGRCTFVGYKKSLVTFTTPVIRGQGPIGYN